MSHNEEIYNGDLIFSPQGASACDLTHFTKFFIIFFIVTEYKVSRRNLEKIGQKK